MKKRKKKGKPRIITEREWKIVHEHIVRLYTSLDDCRKELTDIRSKVANAEVITSGEAWRATHNSLCLRLEGHHARLVRLEQMKYGWSCPNCGAIAGEAHAMRCPT